MFIYIGFLALNSLSLAVRVSFYFQMQGAHLSHGRDFFPAFRETEGDSECPPTLAVSYVTLIQNN